MIDTAHADCGADAEKKVKNYLFHKFNLK